MRMPVEPPGVPTPYTVHVHPYPTRFHGGQWVTPVFGMPWVRSVSNVLTPNELYPQEELPFVSPSGRGMTMPSIPPGAVQGLGAASSGCGCSGSPDARGRLMQPMLPSPAYITHDGLFRRPQSDGGGIFNRAIGDDPPKSAAMSAGLFIGAAAAGALLTWALLDRRKR